ncbi:MAG: oprM 3 [Flavipsychrobacter sp.]|nr:oprM 3 [Flavipsychrobacter sp.]
MFDRAVIPLTFLFLLSFHLSAQDKNLQVNTPANSLATEGMQTYGEKENALTLQDCLRYALKNQPALNQAYIDEAIARTNNAIAFSPWLPQVTGAANYQHYFQLPTVFTRISGVPTPIQSGVYNTSVPSIAVTQNLFSTDLLLASKTAKLNIEASHENTTARKIELVSGVSKAFYDLLLSIAEIRVYKEDTARLKKNRTDAYNRYVSGVVDKVDYKQASISLNNSMSRLKTATESIAAKYASLKQLMGYPSEKTFTINFDTVQMMQEIYIDTLATLHFEKRIEYQLLQTARKIQRETTMYYQLGWIPSLSAFYNYNYAFQANDFEDLYNQAYPYSLFGLQLNVPLFTGFRRNENIHKAKLQERRTDWDDVNLRLGIYTQYRQALAAYKSNLYYLHAQGDNATMAREVYNIVKLQYSEGIKAYLDVIVAESDLQTSEVNYLNALFQLLESKIDLEKAMGDIPTEI